jgi:hypothetical protein
MRIYELDNIFIVNPWYILWIHILSIIRIGHAKSCCQFSITIPFVCHFGSITTTTDKSAKWLTGSKPMDLGHFQNNWILTSKTNIFSVFKHFSGFQENGETSPD